ncbi:shortage in chiasmata 1 [Prunus dulcis]|uniref:Shortage in chiasmata 1 n=1 Tax=Prunus dulcis TaxID=3755 RepID=A0A4Y1R2F0_PRUDU|nr:shortage in chiasmata 1 [Prunus dulcis]
MRTRYLNIDYFTVTPIQALETLTFLHLPIPHLAHSHLSTFNGLHFLHFDSVLEFSLQIEQLPIETALSKFFSDVLPQSIDLDAPDFEIVPSSPTSRSFGSGSHGLQFSEKAEVLKREKELENQLTFASGPLEIEIRKKDNGRTDEEKDAIKYNVLQFETQELDVFLENAYIYEKEEIQIISEVQETQINLETLNLTIEYPWEVHESVHTVEDFHSEYPMDQKAYLFEDDGSYKDQMHFYQTFPLFEANEVTLQTLTGLSVEDELSSVYENIEPQHWAQKDKLNGKELLGTKEYGILEQCLRSDVGSLDITPEMDLLSMVEMSQIQGNIAYQGVSLGACFQSMSPVVFQEFQILDLDTSQNFEVLFTAQTANEPETCHWMFNRDVNFSTLIVSHELALVDETFKSLPVPVLSDHEKISSLYVVIEETLNDLKPQPLSASDRIYLDWHLLEKDKCNFQTYSSHQKMLEDMSSLSTCFDWDSYDEGKLVYDFAFSDDTVDGLNTEENKEIQELLSDGIPMLAGHLGDGSAKLSDDNFPQPKNGEDIDKRSAERATSFFESMSQFSDFNFFLNPRKASTGENSNCAVTKVDNTATFTEGEQSHSTSAPVGNINDQKSKELLNIFPGEEKNDMRSKEAANEVEARSMPLPNPSMPSAMDTEHTQQNMMSFPGMVIIVNTQNLDKEMIVSRRSTYQKILAKEKEGAQVVERDSDLPVDIIISSAICLVWYDCRNIGKKATALDEASSCLPLCIEDIATNVLTLLSFTFSGCIMVFEGEQSFLSTVMESSDGLYAAAASLGIDLQLFNSYSSELTDEIILSCMGYATKLTRWIYPRMPESETLAESFLTKFPSVNSLTAHAILSSGGLLKEFLEWSYETRICAIQKYQVPDESITLFSALCKYGELEDSKSIMTDCSSSVSSGPDSGRFRKRRKYNGSPDKYEIQMNGLLHLEQLNRFTDGILDPSTISKLPDSCMSKSPKRHDEFRRPRFSQNDLLDQEQGLDMDMMMSPFRVLETYDSQIAKGPQSLSSEGKLSGQKHRSNMPIMNKFDLNTMKNSEILHEDLRGEVIDLTESPVLDEDFSSIANSMKFSSLMPELEIDSTRKSKAARKLSFDSSSHRTFPTAAEINSSSTVWHSVKDPRKSSHVGANNNSDTDLEHDVFSLRHHNKPLEESFMQRSGGKSQGLHLHENDISQYGGTPLKNALRLGNSQQNTPWTIEFLNRIKEKSRLRQQSLPRDLSGPSLGYLGNVSKVTKRRSPSIIEFFKYQGGNTPRRLPETKRQKRPLQSSSSSKKEKGSASPLTAWTPADKRARKTLSFAMNDSGSQTKLVWSDGSHGLRKKF